MDNLTFNIEDLFSEISERARSEGIATREEWNDLVDEVLEEKRSTMAIDDDDDRQYMVETLQARYDEMSQDTEVM